MRHYLIATLCIFLKTVTFAAADPERNAAFIVDQHMVHSETEQRFAELSKKTAAAFIPGLERLGAQVVDTEAFANALMKDTYRVIFQDTRDAAMMTYQNTLSDEELAYMAEFYRSDRGQAVLAQGLTFDTFGAYASFYVLDRRGIRILRHLPALNKAWETRLQDMHADIEQAVKSSISMTGIADVLEMEDIVRFENEDLRQKVVSAFRASG